MTPDQIHPGHTYELTSGTRWTVKSFTADGRSIIITDGEVTTFDTPHNFARYAVRDTTPAPESDQGEKVAQAQSQRASRGCGVAELTADDWLQIEMAAKGCVSGTSDEWPALAAAIAKLRGKPFVRRVSSAWLEGFCMGAMSMRRTPPAADAVKGDLLAALHGLLNALPSATTHPAIKAARADIAKAEAAE